MSAIKLARPARAERATLAGRYELRERLASSATATVWRAYDRRRRREVALKVAEPDTTDISGRRLLEAEAAAAKRLKHPNIVPVLAAEMGPGTAALAFPLIEGETLARRLGQDPPLSAGEAAEIAEQIANALAHAHSRGVIHRDVKPGNILLGRDGRARLFDFGISATPTRPADGLVEPGMTTGTLPYMAPEQVAGQSPDPATDVYALGAVLYEMLSGQRPYTAATTDELAVVQQRPAAPLADVPPRLADLAFAALDPDPLARPRASVLAARLRGWLEGSAEQETAVVPLAPQTSVVRAAAPPLSSSRVIPRLSGMAAAAAGLIVVGAVAGVLALSVALSRPGPSAPPAYSPYPGVAGSPLPTISLPPTQAPEVGAGGSGGGGGGGKGDHGKGKGKGH